MKLVRSDKKLDSRSCYTTPLKKIDAEWLRSPYYLKEFDQNAYRLTLLEQAYAKRNRYIVIDRENEKCLCGQWYGAKYPEGINGPHLNHALLFNRPNFAQDALEQLYDYVDENPLLWKLIKMRAKWGVDLSIDWADREGRVFELFHFEWDSFKVSEVAAIQEEVEWLVERTDWHDAGERMWARRGEWAHLDYIGQSAWRHKFFNFMEEKFKNVMWMVN